MSEQQINSNTDITKHTNEEDSANITQLSIPTPPYGVIYPPRNVRTPPENKYSILEALTRPHAPHGSIHLDMDLKDCARAAAQTFLGSIGRGRNRDEIEKDLIDVWSSSWSNNTSLIRQCTDDFSRSADFSFDHARQVCFPLSIRSILDLYFRVKKFPKGSIVLFSAITIPDMTVVARDNGIIPVPVDVNLDTLTIRPDILDTLLHRFGVYGGVEGAETSNHPIVAVISAHIYGRRTYLDPILDVCKKYNVPLFEDVAETFAGLDYTGDPRADMSLFSFGSMKAATSLGGAICRVRDKNLYTLLRNGLEEQPMQDNKTYAQKILKTTPVILALNGHGRIRLALTTIPMYRTLHMCNFDYITWAVTSLRGFPGPDMMTRLRSRPCDALLETLLYRLRSLATPHYRLNTVTGMYFEGLMQRIQADVQVVCPSSNIRNFWLYPVIVRDAAYSAPALRKAGVDVYQGCTQLAAIPVPAEFVGKKSKTNSNTLLAPIPYNAINFMAHVIYLPIHKLVPRNTMKVIAETMANVLGLAPNDPKQRIILHDAYEQIPASL